MSSHKPKSISRVLAFHFLTAALIPLLILLISLIFFLGVNIRSDVYAENRIVGSGVSREIGAFLRNVDSIFRWMANHSSLHEHSIHEIQILLLTTSTHFQFFESIQYLDKDGVVLTTSPYNYDLIGSNMSSQTFFQEVKRTNRTYWSDTFISPYTDNPTVAVAFPLFPRVMVGYIDLAQLQYIGTQTTETGRVKLIITDSKGTLLSHPKREYVEQQKNIGNNPIVADTLAGLTSTKEVEFEGRKVLCSTYLITPTDWAVLVMQDRKEVYGFLTKLILWVALLILLSGVLSTTMAFFSRRRIVGPIYALMETTAEIAEGRYEQQHPTELNFREINYLSKTIMDMSNKIAAREEQLHKNLAEKEILIKEVHHRVKNNLQLILSILNLKYSNLQDESLRQEMYDSIGRIYAIAQVHEQLYGSKSLNQINISSYIHTLSAYLFSINRYSGFHVKADIQVEDVFLNIEQAIPVGLILFEMISNSLQHGFTDNDKAEIRIHGHAEGGRLSLHYKDNGVSFDPDLFLNASSVGFSIIRELVRQLDGSISCSRNQGPQYDIQFEISTQ